VSAALAAGLVANEGYKLVKGTVQRDADELRARLVAADLDEVKKVAKARSGFWNTVWSGVAGEDTKAEIATKVLNQKLDLGSPQQIAFEEIAANYIPGDRKIFEDLVPPKSPLPRVFVDSPNATIPLTQAQIDLLLSEEGRKLFQPSEDVDSQGRKTIQVAQNIEAFRAFASQNIPKIYEKAQGKDGTGGDLIFQRLRDLILSAPGSAGVRLNQTRHNASDEQIIKRYADIPRLDDNEDPVLDAEGNAIIDNAGVNDLKAAQTAYQNGLISYAAYREYLSTQIGLLNQVAAVGRNTEIRTSFQKELGKTDSEKIFDEAKAKLAIQDLFGQKNTGKDYNEDAINVYSKALSNPNFTDKDKRFQIAQLLFSDLKKEADYLIKHTTDLKLRASYIANGVPLSDLLPDNVVAELLQITGVYQLENSIDYGAQVQKIVSALSFANTQSVDVINRAIELSVKFGISSNLALKKVVEDQIAALIKLKSTRGGINASNFAQVDAALSTLEGLLGGIGALEPIAGIGTVGGNNVQGSDSTPKGPSEKEIRNAREAYERAKVEGDPVALANKDVELADLALAEAEASGNAADKFNAMADQVKAQHALRDAIAEVSHSEIALLIATAEAAGDTLAVAEQTLKDKEQALTEARAKGGKAAINSAEAEVKAASAAVRDEKKAREDSSLRLKIAKASAKDDSVEVAKLNLEEKKKALEFEKSKGKGNVTGIQDAEAAVIEAERGVFEASRSEDQAQQRFLFDTKQKTKASYVAYLKTLLLNPQNSAKEIRELQQQIYELTHSQSDFQFNLPTQLGLPTLYEARRFTQSNGTANGTPTGPGAFYDQRQIVVHFSVSNTSDYQAALNSLLDTVQGPSRYGARARSLP
jgi:hypothetical protein